MELLAEQTAAVRLASQRRSRGVCAPRRPRIGLTWISALVLAGIAAVTPLNAQSSPAPAADSRAVLNQYCTACHNAKLNTAGLAFESLDIDKPSARADKWEQVIRRLRTSTMPPRGLPRPNQAAYDAVASWLESEIDKDAAAHPNPGRSNTVHRLNRTEYHNAIRDLFGLDVDIASLLPGDDTADGGFDNNADVLTITTSHLERFLSVARQITRLATGLPPANPVMETFKVPLHVVQDDRQSEDLPLGSRGGIAIRYDFPADGEYLIKVRLRRQYQDYIMGMGWPQQLDIRLDGKLMKRFTVGGEAPGKPSPASFAGAGNSFGDPAWEKYMSAADDGLEIRVPVKAGPRVVGVAFVREMWEPEFVPQPLQRGRVLTNDEVYMDYASVGSVQIGGPYASTKAAGTVKDTPSRREIFVCQPRVAAEEQPCAAKILSKMARRAYRRPATDRDVQTLMPFFESGRRDGGSFDAGIQFALERLLVDPDFLLRVQRDPPQAAPGQAYRVSNLELASRLSFFLWSSIPDEPLLDLAEKARLSDPAILRQQVMRMLADPRATDALVNDFTAQWLNLRRVPEVVVDPRFYPNFDESLLQAFEQETEMFVASTLREDRSVMDLVNVNYTFVNERLARHYGIPGVYGSRFRRVTLPNTEQRGGLLGQGALLAATSYPDRTSPVLRGKWLLDNIFGMPPPPPPPGVNNSLVDDKQGGKPATIRERLDQHRKNPVCANCHAVIDPVGFALESFDVLGGWRTVDERGNQVDSAGTWPSGRKLDGFTGLRAMLLDRPEGFVGTLTEKLLAYALGRRLETYDRPTVRKIVRDAAAQQYRWSSIVLGIVQSPAFQMRTAPALATRASN
jgi:mono/diheme cytochrome c family protein